MGCPYVFQGQPCCCCCFILLFFCAHAKGFNEQRLHHRSPRGPDPGPSDVPARANKASVRDLPLFFPPSLLTLSPLWASFFPPLLDRLSAPVWSRARLQLSRFLISGSPTGYASPPLRLPRPASVWTLWQSRSFPVSVPWKKKENLQILRQQLFFFFFAMTYVI